MSVNYKIEEKIYLLDIILPIPLNKTFTFYCSQNDYKKIKIGFRVKVPFGKKNKKKIGIVFKKNTLNVQENVYKKIISIIDSTPIISNKQFQILKWVSNYYMSSFSKTLYQLIPNFLFKIKIHENYKPKVENFIKLNREKKKYLKKIKFKKQKEIIDEIIRINNKTKNYNINTRKLIDNNFSKNSLNTLIKNDYLIKYEKKTSRLSKIKTINKKNILNKEEKLVFKRLYKNYKKNNKILFEGSSFLERKKIYTELILKEILNGNRILFIIPDILFKMRIIKEFQNIFGNKITILDPNHSNNYKIENYNSILSGNYNIIIGTKTSIFYPIKNLSLIIIDNEENIILKENRKKLRYNTRDVALIISKMNESKIILGSSNPSLETYYNSRKRIFSLVSFNNSNRIKKNNHITIVNTLEKKIKNKMNGSFSNLLLNNISKSLNKNKQVLIYNHSKFKLDGLNNELNKIFKNKKTDIITNDLKQNILNKKINDIKENKINIILINQLIKSILPIKNLETIGILNTEKMISFPNFRSMEKTFQTINLIINEAKIKFKLYIQTIDPNNNIFIYLKKNQFNSFYKNELIERKKFYYPPYTRLIKINFKYLNNNNAINEAKIFYNKILELLDNKNILGPKIKENKDVYLVLKIGLNKHDISKLKKNIIKIINKLNNKSTISIDVDPIN